MQISIGLVGLGRFGSQFAGLFKAHPNVNRIALCDRETDLMRKFAEDPAFKDKFDSADAYESLDAICNADLDAIVLFTQPWLHAPQAVKVMESGKDVFSAAPVIELPNGDEILDWCETLVETSRRTGKRYMLGETTYFRPQAVYCRRKASEGAFGKFVYSEGEYFHDMSAGLRLARQRWLSGKAGDEYREVLKASGSEEYAPIPMHYPTHSISGPMCVMNAHAAKVSAWGFRDPENDVQFNRGFGNETALFHMSNGATMRICEYRQVGHRSSEKFSLIGTSGCFEDDNWITAEGSTSLTEAEMRGPLPAEVTAAFEAMRGPEFYGGHGGSHAYLVNEFVEAVAGNRLPAVNVWDACRYTAAGVMAHKSALRDGETLEVPDWGDAP